MPRTSRVTIVAPHPDDEVFGVGGLMRELVGRGHRLRIVAVTDGEAAFGSGVDAERRALAARRVEERDDALRALGIAADIEVISLGIPDAAVARHEDDLAAQLAKLAGPLLFATWRHDGHPDHEAVGRAASVAAERTGIRLLEYVVWAPHRGGLPVDGEVRRTDVALPAATLAAKRTAMAAFRSQLEPSPDGRPVVPSALVDRLATADEVLLG